MTPMNIVEQHHWSVDIDRRKCYRSEKSLVEDSVMVKCVCVLVFFGETRYKPISNTMLK